MTPAQFAQYQELRKGHVPAGFARKWALANVLHGFIFERIIRSAEWIGMRRPKVSVNSYYPGVVLVNYQKKTIIVAGWYLARIVGWDKKAVFYSLFLRNDDNTKNAELLFYPKEDNEFCMLEYFYEAMQKHLDSKKMECKKV